MQNLLFQAICRVGIFMICAQAIVHFRPKEAYEKYLKLLVSAMVLVQLFLPLGSFLVGAGGEEAARELERFKKEMEQAVKEAEENAAAADALLEQMTLEEVRSRMEEQNGARQQEAPPGTGREGGGGGQGVEPEGEGLPEAEPEPGPGKTGGAVPEDDVPEGAGGDSGRGGAAIEVEAVEPVRIGTVSGEE